MVQWTPFDVKIMEHTQRIEHANQLGWIIDPAPITQEARTGSKQVVSVRRRSRVGALVVALALVIAAVSIALVPDASASNQLQESRMVAGRIAFEPTRSIYVMCAQDDIPCPPTGALAQAYIMCAHDDIPCPTTRVEQLTLLAPQFRRHQPLLPLIVTNEHFVGLLDGHIDG